MVAPCRDIRSIDVSPTLAHELYRNAARLPMYENREFYSRDLQALVSNQIRESCADGFDWLVGVTRERLARWPYCVLLRGLRFDEGNKVFIAINRAFGELVAPPFQKPRAQLVHYVQPSTDIPSARGGRESERLHTDTADWERPVELISMVCVRKDKGGGGRSLVLDIDTVRNEAENRLGSEVVKMLETEPVPWLLAPYWGGGLTWRPVLSRSSICWRRYTINLALQSGSVRISDSMQAALDAFEDLIMSTAPPVDFLMGEGELLCSDNYKTIHARTPIPDAESSDRLMIRGWIRAS